MEKKREKLDGVRKPFYAMTDGCGAFGKAVATIEDAELKRKRAKVIEALAELGDHLNENYLWD